MKTFDDLVFEPHPSAMAFQINFPDECHWDPYISKMAEAVQAYETFPNGYHFSVLCGAQFYSNGVDTFEVGVRYCEDGLGTPWEIHGWQTRQQVEELMKNVQLLK